MPHILAGIGSLGQHGCSHAARLRYRCNGDRYTQDIGFELDDSPVPGSTANGHQLIYLLLSSLS
jgi:hypothetical protein